MYNAPVTQSEVPSPAPAEAPLSPAPKPLRVTWVAGPRTLEEYGRILQPLAVGMLDELIELTAVCPEKSDCSRLPSPPARLIRYGRPNWWAFWEATPGLDELAAEVRRSGANLVHALDVSAARLAMRVALRANVPCLVGCWGLRDHRALRRLESPPTGLVCASELVREEMRRRRAPGARRLHLLQPGVHQVRHASCFTQPQYRVTLVAGGRLDDLAAWRAVLGAFARVVAAKHDCAYFLMGIGKAEGALRLLSERLGLRSDLAFVDWQAHWQLEEILKAADIYITPSPAEEVDVQCLLAMAAGVPVLAAGAGASDFLCDGQTAAFFRAGDEEDLSAKLLRFLEDRAAARALAENALAHLRERHTPARMVAELTKIYRAAGAESAE